MQWFRANLKVGARLGLFALTLQIVLSFGHVHLGGLRHSTGRLSVAGTHSVPPDPQQQPISDADEYCAICASIHLAATSLLPQAPQLRAFLCVRTDTGGGDFCRRGTAFLRGLSFAGSALRADPTFIRVEVRRSGNLKWARRSLLE
jgi:hypothetical protein